MVHYKMNNSQESTPSQVNCIHPTNKGVKRTTTNIALQLTRYRYNFKYL